MQYDLDHSENKILDLAYLKLEILLVNQATIDHPLFVLLNHEQTFIESSLSKIDACQTISHLKELAITLLDKVEINHHEKEEKLLFTEISKDPSIHAGGPMCSLFFDLHQYENIKLKVETIIGHELEILPHQTDFFEKKVPLVIPVEEHQAGRNLLHYIIKHIDSESFIVSKQYLLLYKSIQTNHINKERNCLYHMCAQLLTKEMADKILRQWSKGTEQ